MSLLLVADIGGTNARFGVLEYIPGEDAFTTLSRQEPSQQQSFKCAEFPDIESVIRFYCDAQGIALPRHACLAIAGPVDGGQVKMTNHNWSFSSASLRQSLSMESVEIINDFAALAYAVPHLKNNALHTLYAAEGNAHAPCAVLGPGTGFGVAALIPTEAGPQVLTGEGGHVDFAPTNAREIAILQHLLKHQERVSVENLVSGQGLVTLYESLATLEGIAPLDYTAADISRLGLAREDRLCREVMECFCALLGSVAGDKALTYGALGGIYLGGGITPRLVDFLPGTEFLSRLQNKDPLIPYLRKMPVHVITHPTAALLGSAAWLINRLERAR